MDSLFAQTVTKPLADRMRPRSLNDFAGQEKAVGVGSPLRRMIERDALQSLLLYGPPGTGKTTLAHIIANMTRSRFVSLNAVSSGVPELRKLIGEARDALYSGMGRTIVFIDEIHRFNKAQQDVLLPYVENGTVILIGATTENPFFEVNAPLLSRMKIIRLERLDKNAVKKILQKALADKVNGYGRQGLAMTDEALEALADFSGGDARIALNLLEQAEFMLPDGVKTIDGTVLESVMGDAFKRYDKKGDRHYDTVSAFIKSMRGSDADAALHYLAEMLESGEDVRFIARRIVICAAEDVGNADPMALVVANAAAQAAHFVGLPEAQLPLAQAVCYIANAPKSNACCMGILNARADARNVHSTVPKHLRDAHYQGAKALGHGTGYKYPHDYPGGWVQQQYMPDELAGRKYYFPKDTGAEKALHNKK
ncbi:MAG: replication-associated recombination protein RarA [Phascolarctobacterium sp.]|nr:MAG: replication-associated recombination protein RarA [Phascolarctobacterium sp.]